ncbi:MAG TPA: DEAD/DEAH box helicase [Acidimicrobiia bacterium]|nr:DEAD/DEAH box helicase [Acidimicrobiia bacterium]
MNHFTHLGVPDRLASILSSGGITAPFPIQEATIPDLIAGRDVLGRAPTGSGKTLAFGIPLMMRVAKAAPGRPRGLVLAPTRELAEQISRELTRFGKATDRWVTAVYGGVGYDAQRSQLRRGTDVLVATPGRLADLMEEGSVSLADVEIVVIDEADRMADMGFMPQVRHLMDRTNPVRQTVLFSATLDNDVAGLTQRYQTDPVNHAVGGNDANLEAAHYFWRVAQEERIDITAEIIESATPTLVFTRTRHGADRVARQLDRMGLRAAAIHGGRSQSQRMRALRAFGEGRVDALIATDVAARGIHVEGVASVVHFDLPEDHKDYLHRSGRTARAGAAGVVVSLVLAEQMSDLRQLQRKVGFHDALHDPDNGWLSAKGGSRVGERPRTEEPVVRKIAYQSRSRRRSRRR